MALVHPNFDPIALSIGPFDIRWYALAYVAGIVIGQWIALRLSRQPPHLVAPQHFDAFFTWLVLGIILGGRFGYVLFYNPAYYLDNPSQILAMWKGGMSFHGGTLGVATAMVLFCRNARISLLAFADIVACVVPIGIGFGRLANYINGELWGRPSSLPWAMIFPNADAQPRHPSQIYEMLTEGVLLALLLLTLSQVRAIRHRPGLLTGTFCLGYWLARSTVEVFREPDADMVLNTLTMGQFLSLPLLITGLWLYVRGCTRPPVNPTTLPNDVRPTNVDPGPHAR